MLCNSDQLDRRLAEARTLWLLLDYDGTLADFAPTPDDVNPDAELIDLLSKLAQEPRFRIAVISGRRLSHVRSLLPMPGIWLAGTYGIEIQTPAGELIVRESYGATRPTLEALKPSWEHLIAQREGFFLEDKFCALALHARFADEDEAETVLETAHRMAADEASSGPFRLLGGHKFLEIGPKLAHKGHTVEYMLVHYPWPGALPLYLGDDDKDEEAFTGKEVGSFRATVEQTITLNYTAIMNKGMLSIKVRSVRGQTLWQAELEEDMIDSVQIPVEQAGVYTVLVEGQNTGGGFGVTWAVN